MRKDDLHSAYNQPVYDDEPDCYHDREQRIPLGWRVFLTLAGAAVAWLFVWPVVKAVVL